MDTRSRESTFPQTRRRRSQRSFSGFGGNAWNGQDVGVYLHELFPDCDVVTFHYRGYSPSTGSPSAEALTADAPLVYDAAVARVKPRRVIAVGFSIGSGVAARLAAVRKLDGLILVTPFNSLKAVAQSMYPWLPIGPFFEHEFDAAGALEESKVPVAIIAAQRDEIVPARTDRGSAQADSKPRSSTGRSATQVTTTSTPDRTSRRRCGRLSRPLPTSSAMLWRGQSWDSRGRPHRLRPC